MKKIYTAFLFLMAAVMSGCYEDKGNYDYKDINQLTVAFPKVLYGVTFGEELKVEPILNKAIGEDTPGYLYTWYVNGQTKPGWNKRNFSWTADEIIKNGYVTLEITDINTGIMYMTRSSLNVNGIYENTYSWMLLSDIGGKSRLSYFSCLEYDDDKEEFVKTKFYEDVYTSVNGGELGNGPIAIQEHFRQGVDWQDEVIGNVCIFQESGAIDLSGESFEKQIDMVQAFDGEKYPDGAIIYPATFMDRVDVLSDQYGRLYSRFKATSTVYNSEYFLQTPLRYEDEKEPLEMCRVARGFYRANRTGYAFIYDGKNKRMLYIVNSDYSDEIAGAGKIAALPPCGDNDDISKIVPLDDMEGYELIKMSMFGYGYPNYGFFLLLREESSDKIFLQILKVTGSAGKPKIVKVDRYEIKGLSGIPSLAAFPLSEPDYVFFAVDKEIFYYELSNTDAPALHYKGFDFEITAMNADSQYGNHMGVGLASGDFFILKIDNAKNTPENKRIIYTSDKKVGRIVDIQYKQMDHWNY